MPEENKKTELTKTLSEADLARIILTTQKEERYWKRWRRSNL